MPDTWAIDIAQALGGGKRSGNIAPAGGTPGDSALATVTSVSPLSISFNSIVISERLYINPCLVLEAQPGRIGAMFDSALSILAKCPEITPGPVELFGFLKAYHDAVIVHIGDTVVVKQFGTSFCITEKVVLVS